MKNIISNFKTFFEFANYGFEVQTSKTIGGSVTQDGDKPINYIDSNLIVLLIDSNLTQFLALIFFTL